MSRCMRETAAPQVSSPATRARPSGTARQDAPRRSSGHGSSRAASRAEKGLEPTAPTERNGPSVSVPQTHARAERDAGRRDAPWRPRSSRCMLEERTRWAMTIHDGLTQSVTSAVLELQMLRHRIETDPAAAVDVAREVEEAHPPRPERDPRGAVRARRGPAARRSVVRDASCASWSSAGSCPRASRSRATSTRCRTRCSRRRTASSARRSPTPPSIPVPRT